MKILTPIHGSDIERGIGLRYLFFCVLLLCISSATALSQESYWEIEVFAGTALNAQSPLTIEQEGSPPIVIPRARYATRPLADVPYYVVRSMRWQGDRGWGLELIHHKLYLLTPHEDIDAFAITHGFNFITFNRGWQQGPYRLYMGLGPVLAHPETIIRGQALPWWEWGDDFHLWSFLREFYFCGLAGHMALARAWNFHDPYHVQLEGKVTGAYAQVPIKDGQATVPNLAFHILFGVGRAF